MFDPPSKDKMHLVHFVRKKQTGAAFPFHFPFSSLSSPLFAIRNPIPGRYDSISNSKWLVWKKKKGWSRRFLPDRKMGLKISMVKRTEYRYIPISTTIQWKISGWNIRREYKVTFNRRSIFDYRDRRFSTFLFVFFFLYSLTGLQELFLKRG